MKLIEPEESIGDEEVAHFVAAEIKVESAPVHLLALAWVSMFVKVSSIEICEAVFIGNKVTGDPIEDDADACGVATIDEIAKFVGVSKARGGGEVPSNLVSPRFVARMFGDG